MGWGGGHGIGGVVGGVVGSPEGTMPCGGTCRRLPVQGRERHGKRADILSCRMVPRQHPNQKADILWYGPKAAPSRGEHKPTHPPHHRPHPSLGFAAFTKPSSLAFGPNPPHPPTHLPHRPHPASHTPAWRGGEGRRGVGVWGFRVPGPCIRKAGEGEGRQRRGARRAAGRRRPAQRVGCRSGEGNRSLFSAFQLQHPTPPHPGHGLT